ncbi:iron-containing alcohol dehydrogenase, partial [Pseudomonas aeruginosa]|nr:iron-containing alcohol dehydrogenase [Pseudomonas aeruginosa]
MRTFVYQGLPSRVVFGDGALQHLGEEIEKLGAERALLLSTPDQRELAERLAGLLG